MKNYVRVPKLIKFVLRRLLYRTVYQTRQVGTVPREASYLLYARSYDRYPAVYLLTRSPTAGASGSRLC